MGDLFYCREQGTEVNIWAGFRTQRMSSPRMLRIQTVPGLQSPHSIGVTALLILYN
jgi:hypothetical protein